jgi:hypothetical protein
MTNQMLNQWTKAALSHSEFEAMTMAKSSHFMIFLTSIFVISHKNKFKQLKEKKPENLNCGIF